MRGERQAHGGAGLGGGGVGGRVAGGGMHNMHALPRHDLVQSHAQREYIHRAADLPRQHLRGEERGIALIIARDPLVDLHAQAVVAKLVRLAVSDVDVFRLDVHVHQPRRVQRLQPARDLVQHLPDVLLGQGGVLPLAREVGNQVPARAEGGLEVEVVVFGPHAEVLGEVGASPAHTPGRGGGGR